MAITVSEKPLPSGEGLTFEKVWAIIQESDAKFRQSLRESQADFDRRITITNKIVGDLGNRFGELAEHMILPNIKEKFNKLGFEFTRTASNIRIQERKDSSSISPKALSPATVKAA